MLDLLYHKGNPLITAVIDNSIFKKYLGLYLRKNVRRRYYFYSAIAMMKLSLISKHNFYTDEKLFELFCSKNDFPKYFARCQHLFV